jgi:hypothetical protein
MGQAQLGGEACLRGDLRLLQLLLERIATPPLTPTLCRAPLAILRTHLGARYCQTIVYSCQNSIFNFALIHSCNYTFLLVRSPDK